MRAKRLKASVLWVVAATLSGGALTTAICATIQNLTGLPTYPNLNKAAMDGVFRTESPGRWCSRFTATTSDSLSAVEDWYRRILVRASETDLSHDEQFRNPALSGIKLTLGLDYVALYRIDNQPTIIELHRCSWTR